MYGENMRQTYNVIRIKAHTPANYCTQKKTSERN